jgi:hypothetical protein
LKDGLYVFAKFLVILFYDFHRLKEGDDFLHSALDLFLT